MLNEPSGLLSAAPTNLRKMEQWLREYPGSLNDTSDLQGYKWGGGILGNN